MAGGEITVNGPVKNYDGKLTVSVLLLVSWQLREASFSAMTLGSLPFLQSFFPNVLRRMADAKQDEYCIYNSQALTAFTSSLHIAGLLSALVAGRVTKTIGRQAVMLLGGATFFVGATINAAAVNILMLILGRLLLVGVGFTNQATPVYLAETAPPRWRGAFSTGFQFFIGIGVIASSLITRQHTSLGVGASPSASKQPQQPSSCSVPYSFQTLRAASYNVASSTRPVQHSVTFRGLMSRYRLS